MAHRRKDWELCVFTDASDVFWAGVLAQCPKEELDKDLAEQRLEPLAFLGAAFNKTECGWTTFEKEAFDIYQVFKKVDYLLMVEINSHVFTDHRNLLFIYNPTALEPKLGRHVVSKVKRWALYLSRFSYTVEHIMGERNVMADIMTRGYSRYRGRPSSVRRITHVLLKKDIVDSPLTDNFEWPTDDVIRKSQRRHAETKPTAVVGAEDGRPMTQDGKTWIPEDANLQIKLLVVAHCGACGHRGIESTKIILSEGYIWEGLALAIVRSL